MQPTPPKSRKPQYRRPFYDAGKKTSAEIVSEARNATRPLETSRPFTPAESNRRLFGSVSRSTEGRPPSAFSIGPNAFSEPGSRSGSRPPTGKLAPLTNISDSGSSSFHQVTPISPEKPSLQRRSSDNVLTSREASDYALTAAIKNEKSVDSGSDYDIIRRQNQKPKFPLPPKSMEPSITKTGRPSSRQNVAGRRAQSGPKEHSSQRSQDKDLRKSNSFDSLERDVKSADSGVVSDTFRKSDRRANERLSRDSGLRPLSTDSIVSEIYSSKNISTDSGLNLGHSAYNSKSKATNDKQLEVARPDSSSTESDSDSQAALFKENIEPLLKQMELNYLHSDMEALSVNFDVLWKSLQFCGLFNKASGSGSARRRTSVLRVIFRFVESDSPEVILKLCKVALMMKVTGNNLVNICKLIFKISKDNTKDVLFKEHDILRHITEIIRTADINLLFEGIIYATGSIKFLAANTILHDELIKADCIQCFVEFLNKIKSLASSESQAIHLSHLIVQASAAIRNIADIPSARASFLNSGLIRLLLDLLEPFWKDPDYMLNVSRILSKLTQYSESCHLICESSDSLQIFLKALSHHSNEKDIVVRLAFILGNVAAKDSEARSDLYFKYNCLDSLLDLLSKYFKICSQNGKKDRKNSDGKDDEDTEIDKANEILVKAVRVIANMSMNASVAADIIDNEAFIDITISILEIQMDGPVVEELLINTAGMLNNLSYYASGDSALTRRAKKLTEALIHLLFIDNMDCITEATRVFGNFTRSRDIRILLRERKVVQMLLTLLESTEREVVFCACGVLINLMVDNENRQILHHDKGVRKLIDALKDFGQTDWQLSCMICQTLWNYSEKITSAISCFGEEETEDLIQILQDYTDPELAFEYRDNPHVDLETIDLMRQIWSEQFEQVGLRLLNRIEEHHTELRPLVEEPD